MLKERSLKQALAAAQRGDAAARDELIKSHLDFIAKVSSQTCKKYLTWGNDDELSIAQVAFNEAIDKFRPGGGASFHGYARRVIHSRLVDYIRKEARHSHLSLTPMNPGDEELSRHDIIASTELYQEGQQQAVLAAVVDEFINVLKQYSVTLDELVKISPKHRDSKETLQQVALCLTNEPELMEYLKKHKLLPIKKLELLTGVKRRVLEKGRKYTIALALILSEDRFFPLRDFTQLPDNRKRGA
ncbi:MAG: sigma-70 family RNA polymerase sigma factor [Desulfotomaculaceae bacterium]